MTTRDSERIVLPPIKINNRSLCTWILIEHFYRHLSLLYLHSQFNAHSPTHSMTIDRCLSHANQSIKPGREQTWLIDGSTKLVDLVIEERATRYIVLNGFGADRISYHLSLLSCRRRIFSNLLFCMQTFLSSLSFILPIPLQLINICLKLFNSFNWWYFSGDQLNWSLFNYPTIPSVTEHIQLQGLFCLTVIHCHSHSFAVGVSTYNHCI